MENMDHFSLLKIIDIIAIPFIIGLFLYGMYLAEKKGRSGVNDISYNNDFQEWADFINHSKSIGESKEIQTK